MSLCCHSSCVVWIFLGVGFCVRKMAICSWDLSGRSGQFRLGFQFLQFQEDESVKQSVLHISVTSQCTVVVPAVIPSTCRQEDRNPGVPYLQKMGGRVYSRGPTFHIHFVSIRHSAAFLPLTQWRNLKLRMCLLCPIYVNWANDKRQRSSL